jgi:hypothetical protein
MFDRTEEGENLRQFLPTPCRGRVSKGGAHPGARAQERRAAPGYTRADPPGRLRAESTVPCFKLDHYARRKK